MKKGTLLQFGFTSSKTEPSEEAGTSETPKEKYEKTKRKRSYNEKWEDEFPGLCLAKKSPEGFVTHVSTGRSVSTSEVTGELPSPSSSQPSTSQPSTSSSQSDIMLHDSDDVVMICQTCRSNPDVADRTSSFWIGCSSFHKSTLQSHWGSLCHKKCVDAKNESARRARLAQGRSCPDVGPMDVVLRELNQEQKEVITKLFNTAYYVAKHEQPFTSYTSLLKLQRKNGLDLRKAYQSDNACRRFVGYIAADIHDEIMQKVRDAKFIGVMFDGATDVSVTEQEMVYVRMLDDDGMPRNIFLSLQALQDAHADGIWKAVGDAFTEHDIPGWKEKVVGMGADGASVNIGIRNSVATRLLADCPWALVLHCVAHRLELGALAGIRSFDELKIIMEILHKIYKQYEYSPKALRELRLVADALDLKVAKPARLAGTRWLPHILGAMRVLLTHYRVLLTHFQHVSQTNASPEVKGRAHYLNQKLTDFKIIRFMFLLWDVLESLSRLSLTLQKNTLTPPDYLDALETANLELIDLTHNHGEHLQHFLHHADDATKMYEGFHILRYPAEADDDRLQQLKTGVINKIRESVNQRLEKPGDPSRPIITASRVLSPSEWPHARAQLAVFGQAELDVLIDHFQPVLARQGFNVVECRREWQPFKVHVAARYRLNRKVLELYANMFRDDDVKARFKNVLMILEICLAQVERGFSSLKRIKSDWRASLKNDMLNKLLIIVLEGPDFDEYRAEAALQRWWHGGQRKRRPDFEAVSDSDDDDDDIN